MERKRKPIVLWLADQEGWAYDSIVKQVSKLLPQYTHTVWYMMKEDENNLYKLNHLVSVADMIVSMYLRYQDNVSCKEKVVTMLTGLRPFEI